jgi:hypothetical protein
MLLESFQDAFSDEDFGNFEINVKWSAKKTIPTDVSSEDWSSSISGIQIVFIFVSNSQMTNF